MKNESQKSFPLWGLLFGILTIVFITLKLTGFITWSWLWVFCPLWFPPVIVLLLIAVVFILSLITNLIKKAVGK